VAVKVMAIARKFSKKDLRGKFEGYELPTA
jgi:hypothetical protein